MKYFFVADDFSHTAKEIQSTPKMESISKGCSIIFRFHYVRKINKW